MAAPLKTSYALAFQGTLHLPAEESAAFQTELQDMSAFVLRTMTDMHDVADVAELIRTTSRFELAARLARIVAFAEKEVALVVIERDRQSVAELCQKAKAQFAGAAERFAAMATVDDLRAVCCSVVDGLTLVSSVLRSVDEWFCRMIVGYIGKARDVMRGMLEFKKANAGRAIAEAEVAEIAALGERILRNIAQFVGNRAGKASDPAKVAAHAKGLEEGVAPLVGFVCGTRSADDVRAFRALLDAVEEDLKEKSEFGVVVQVQNLDNAEECMRVLETCTDESVREAARQALVEALERREQATQSRPRVVVVRAKKVSKPKSSRFRELLDASYKLADQIATIRQIVETTEKVDVVDTFSLEEMKQQLLFRE